MPGFNRLAQVWQSFPPNVHRASIVLQSPHFLNANHVSSTFHRLDDLLEQNQVLILNSVHVLRKYGRPLLNCYFNSFFVVLFKERSSAIRRSSQDKALIQVVSYLLQAVLADIEFLNASLVLVLSQKGFKLLAQKVHFLKGPVVVNFEFMGLTCDVVGDVLKKIFYLQDLK